VQHALGFAGGARRVQDEERVFGVHWFARAIRADLLDLVFIDEIAAGLHLRALAGPCDDQHVLHVGAGLQRFIDIVFQRNDLAAAHALIGGDDEGGFAILHAAGD
jgi:hypothetical protein